MTLPPVSPLAERTTFVGRWLTNPRAVLAYSLLLGALPGTWGWLHLSFNTDLTASLGGIGLVLGALVYYTLTGYAGVQLLRRSAPADTWAIAALLPQLIQVQTHHVLYKAVCGLQATFTVGSDGFNFGFGGLSAFWIQIGDLSHPTRVAINLVPVAFLSYFYRQRERSRLTSA